MGRIVLFVAVSLLAVGCAVRPSGDVGEGASKDAHGTITMIDNRFTPDDTEATANRPLTINITNRGSSVHDFAIEALDVDTGSISPGSTAHVTFTVPRGTTEFTCVYHSGMRGRIEGS